MQEPVKNEGLAPSGPHHEPSANLHEQTLPLALAHHRSADELEAESVKYNVARIVRLSSGAFALFSHYRAGALDLIKVGTLESLADFIPTAEQCSYIEPRVQRTTKAKLTTLDLADLGL